MITIFEEMQKKSKCCSDKSVNFSLPKYFQEKNFCELPIAKKTRNFIDKNT